MKDNDAVDAAECKENEAPEPPGGEANPAENAEDKRDDGAAQYAHARAHLKGQRRFRRVFGVEEGREHAKQDEEKEPAPAAFDPRPSPSPKAEVALGAVAVAGVFLEVEGASCRSAPESCEAIASGSAAGRSTTKQRTKPFM